MFSIRTGLAVSFSMVIDRGVGLTVPTGSNGLSLIQPAIDANLTSPNFPHNRSASALPTIHCDGATYGTDISVASCMDALHTIPDRMESITFGDRNRGSFDVTLPHRFISSKPYCLPLISETIASGIALTLMSVTCA